jgi:hypothetical protein
MNHFRRPYIGPNPKLEIKDLQFESNYENGNLDFVVRV